MTDPKVLALVAVPRVLRPVLVDAFTRVWEGEVEVHDSVPPLASLAVVCLEDPEGLELGAWRQARVPTLAVLAAGARRMRGQVLPEPLVWTLGLDDLDPRVLSLAVRHALALGETWRLRDELRRLHPIVELGEVAPAVSHELGNPLTGLVLNLELARNALAPLRFPEQEGLQALVADALEGARHVTRIAADLDRVSRPVGRLASVELRPVVEAARRLSAEPLRGVTVSVTASRALTVRVDERRFTQVLVNLFRNAAQALDGCPSPRIDVALDAAGDRAVVRFADNGPGVPNTVRDRLFEVGATTKATGSGLGLALSRQYLSDMGGTLDHVPSPLGAVFEVRVPRGVATEHHPTLVPDISLVNASLLVVDDVPLVCRSLARALTPVGRVDTTSDPEQALAWMASRRYDVALFDMNLADTTGRALWGRLRALPTADVRHVVILSGAFTDEEQRWLDAEGLLGVRKPIGADDVRDLVIARIGKK
jgi:signal transduction histidine kinase/CheY-like chemotaxis protein